MTRQRLFEETRKGEQGYGRFREETRQTSDRKPASRDRTSGGLGGRETQESGGSLPSTAQEEAEARSQAADSWPVSGHRGLVADQ